MKDYIKGITDDYLIGLSNKGIVKRGHKDYEALETAPDFIEGEDSITVKLPEVEVVLRNPLSESKCSCPSKTLCKHIVMAVHAVWLKNGDNTEERSGPQETVTENQDIDITVSYPEMCDIPISKLMNVWRKNSEPDREQIKKAFLEADITLNANTISVRALGETVTILEPFSTSKCSCRKSSLCSHKAFAALAVRFRYSQSVFLPLFEKYIEQQQIKQSHITKDLEERREQIVKDVQRFLIDFMNVGLNRAAQSSADELLRLSVMSHNEGMPNMEQRLRQLEQEWIHYHKGGGLSKISVFLGRICSLYQLTVGYLAKDEEAVKMLVGTFRAEYEQADDCRLYGITNREYEGKGGFVGNIYYFLDWEKGNILTYQDIRPNLYEGRKKTAAAMMKEEAPWGLDIRKEELAGKEIFLKGPKISEDGRLSVSQSTKGEIVGAVSLTREMMGNYYYEDFLNLLENYMEFLEEGTKEKDRLVFIKPERIEREPYDEVAQQFRASFFDKEGCVMWLQVDYHKSREYLIRHMERLFDRLEKGQKKELVFFGIVSLGERGISFYPYEYFEYNSLEGKCL